MEIERERNIHVREKHQLVASCTCPDGGTEPTTQGMCPDKESTGDLSVHGPKVNQLRAVLFSILSNHSHSLFQGHTDVLLFSSESFKDLLFHI